VFLGCAVVPAHAGNQPPNIVLIYADDLGYGDLGCYAPGQQLYDLDADLYQTRNVIREHPEVARDLEAMLSIVRIHNQYRPNLESKK
jgi:hypothetical protein